MGEIGGQYGSREDKKNSTNTLVPGKCGRVGHATAELTSNIICTECL